MGRIHSEERNPWLQEFMPLYEQAVPLIQSVVERLGEARQTNPETILEANVQLRRILECAKSLPRPEKKEFRTIQRNLIRVLSRCIAVDKLGLQILHGLEQGESRLAIRINSVSFDMAKRQAYTQHVLLATRVASLSENLIDQAHSE